MYFGDIAVSAIVGMLVKIGLCLAAIVVPCLLYVRRVEKGLVKFGIGALIYLVFVVVLKRLCDFAFLDLESSVSTALNTSVFGKTMYDAVTIGIFAETGLLIGYKAIGSKCNSMPCAVNVGLGAGCAFAFVTLIQTAISAVYSLMYNSMTRGEFYSKFTADDIYEKIEKLSGASLSNEVFSGLIAVVIIAGYVALSCIIYMSFVKRSAVIMYPTAIIMNCVLVIPILLCAHGIPAYLCFIAEVVLCGIIIAMTIFAYKGYNAVDEEQAQDDVACNNNSEIQIEEASNEIVEDTDESEKSDEKETGEDA